MQQTSLEAYGEKKTNRDVVFSIIKSYKEISNGNIAKVLNWEINCVTGRTRELVKKGVVEKGDVIIQKNNRPVIRWRVRE